MKRSFFVFATCLSMALLCFTAGCTGTGAEGPPLNVVPAPLAPSLPSITFTSPGVQTFTVSEPGYSGTFAGTSSDTNVATVSVSNAQSASRGVDATARRYDTVATFTVTPVGGGTATITVSDANGNQTQIPVTVTSATFTPQSHN